MSKPTATPVPELFARPVGKFEWTCPNCGQEHPFTHYPWRRGNLQCQRCLAHFRLGVGLDIIKNSDCYLMGKYNSYTANRYNPIGTRFDGGKVYGTLEWACPACSQPQSTFANYEGRIECARCAKPFFLSLLIWRSPRGPAIKPPIDSIVKGLDARETIQPLSAPTLNQGTGETS